MATKKEIALRKLEDIQHSYLETLKKRECLELQKIQLENKNFRKTIAMCISGTLGVIALIGVFWGKETLANIGIVILLFTILLLMMLAGSNDGGKV